MNELIPERDLGRLDALALGRILCEAERIMAKTNCLMQKLPETRDRHHYSGRWQCGTVGKKKRSL